MSNRDYDYLFKLVIIGNSGVGKSSLLLRYTDDTFSENYISTIGVDFKFKTFPLDGKKLKLQIWDTAGQERFRTITNSYYKGADAMIIVYDSTCQQSFDEIEKSWMEEIQKHADKNTTILLIGNKSDLSNKIVNSDTAQQYAKQRSMLFYEASAKTGQGINDAFEGLARLLVILRDSKQLEKKQKRKQKQQNTQQTTEETPKPFETSLQPQQNINLWLRQNDKGEKKEQQCSC